jgi:hypothetical protein
VPDGTPEEKVASILRSLPLKHGAEHHISVAAALVVGWSRFPQGRPTRGDKAAIRELAKVARHLRDTLSVLEDLSVEASYELGKVPIDINYVLLHSLRPRDLPKLISDLEKRVLLAKELLEVKPTKRSARRPKDLAAWFTTVALLGFYEEFTGKKATVTVDPTKERNTRGGRFVDLVSEVFKVLGLRASPSSQADAATKGDCWRFDMDFDDLVNLLTKRESRKGMDEPAP